MSEAASGARVRLPEIRQIVEASNNRRKYRELLQVADPDLMNLIFECALNLAKNKNLAKVFKPFERRYFRSRRGVLRSLAKENKGSRTLRFKLELLVQEGPDFLQRILKVVERYLS